MNQAVAQWIVGRDTGLSSMAILAFMEGAREGPFPHPHDPGDLGRCLRLLDIAPEYAERLFEMTLCGPEWSGLVRHWDALTEAYHRQEETGKLCHRMMQTVIALGDKTTPSCRACGHQSFGPPEWTGFALRIAAKWSPGHREERLELDCSMCGQKSWVEWADGKWLT